MRRLMVSLSVCVCAGLLVPAIALATDTYEPNNTYGTAYGPMGDGVTYTSYLSTANDDDYYWFYVSSSSSVHIVMQVPAGVAPPPGLIGPLMTYGVYLLNADPGSIGPAWWNSLAYYEKATDGQQAVIDFTVPSAGFYRVGVSNFNDIYSADKPYTLSVAGPGVGKPPATLTVPTAPSTSYLGRSYTSVGYLKPRHASGAHAVRIQAYRYEGGKWVYKKYFTTTNANYSNYTKYYGRIAFPSRGRWRIRAHAPADGIHRASYSGYRYVTVR